MSGPSGQLRCLAVPGMGAASAAAFCLAVDALLGAGATQWIADLCLTETGEMDMAGPMPSMSKVAAGPLLAVSTGFAAMALVMSGRDKRLPRGDTGRAVSRPERDRLLSVIVKIASAADIASFRPIRDVYCRVAGGTLSTEEAAVAYHRHAPSCAIRRDFGHLDATSKVERWRILAAILLMDDQNGRCPKARGEAEHIIREMSATADELHAARAWLEGANTSAEEATPADRQRPNRQGWPVQSFPLPRTASAA